MSARHKRKRRQAIDTKTVSVSDLLKTRYPATARVSAAADHPLFALLTLSPEKQAAFVAQASDTSITSGDARALLRRYSWRVPEAKAALLANPVWPLLVLEAPDLAALVEVPP